MPTVLRWGPYRAFFYSNEGDEPAHIHVRAGSKEVKFWLHDLTVAVNMGFPVHELGDMVDRALTIITRSPSTKPRAARSSGCTLTRGRPCLARLVGISLKEELR